jgi:hypothetical protein
MGRLNDQRGSSRSEDWTRWLKSLVGIYGKYEKRQHDNPVLNYFLVAWHTGKNIIVEELRRW